MLSSLPSEIIVEISSYLSDGDYISLSNANKRLSSLLTSNKRSLKLAQSYYSDSVSLKSFLWNDTTITALDVSNCYWFESVILTNIILGLSVSLQQLHVQGTKLSSKELAEILFKCGSICELSASIHHSDSTFWGSIIALEEETSAQEILCSCIFFPVKEKLGRLKKLSLYGDVQAFNKFIVFLCLCDNLEGVHFELQASDHVLEIEDISEVRPTFSRFASLLPVFSSLRFVSSRIFNGNFMSNFFVASYVKESILDPLCKQYAENRSRFESFWIPHGGMSSPLPLLKAECTALLTADTSVSVMDFKNLTSLCIRADARSASPRVLRDAASRLPHLKLISCAYNSKDFLDFARSHMNLRVIQLQSTCHHDLAGPELAEGLRYLKHLEKFSVDPRYFRDYLTPRGALQRHRPPELAFRVDDPLNLAVTELSNSCHFLNEIEIGVFSTLSQARYDREDHICEGNSKAFATLGKCANLTHLTLANLDLDSMDFISAILIGCSRLRSCRLTNICSSRNGEFISLVVSALRVGLPHSKHLEDFRWEVGKSKNEFKKPIEVEPSFVMDGSAVLDVLRHCRSLRRFAIIADYTVHVNFPEIGILDWSPLVLACFISPTVGWENCSLQIISKHPAFQCYCGSRKAEAFKCVDAFHYHDMIIFDSVVAKVPFS